MRLTLEPLAQRPHEARLADAGLARQQHHLALALLGSLPALEQQADLVLAADKRRQARSVQRLEPALGGAFPRPRAKPGPERESPSVSCRPSSASSNSPPISCRVRAAITTAARLGQGLQPRRQVRRVADHRLLARRAFADQLADDHRAGGDADTGRERPAGR